MFTPRSSPACHAQIWRNGSMKQKVLVVGTVLLGLDERKEVDSKFTFIRNFDVCSLSSKLHSTQKLSIWLGS